MALSNSDQTEDEAILDAILIEVQNSGMDFANDARFNPSVILAQAKQALLAWHQSKVAKAQQESEIVGEIKALRHIVGSDAWYRPHQGVPIKVKDRLEDLALKAKGGEGGH